MTNITYILFCKKCSQRIPDQDLKRGAAFHDDPYQAICAKCSGSTSTAAHTKTAGRVKTAHSAPSGHLSKSGATENSKTVWLILGGSVMGLLLLYFAFRGKQPVPNKETAITKTDVAANKTVAPAVVKVEENRAAAPPEVKQPVVVEPVPLKQPAAPEEKPVNAREDFARRQWNELKAEAEKAGSGGIRAASANDAVRNFSINYASTSAGKEAAEFLKTMKFVEWANYSRDFHVGPGWRYLWNPNGPIGESGKYAPLVWNETHAQYCGDAKTYPGGPPNYGRLSKGGGHPGQGVKQGMAADRFAIAAYSLQAGQSGKCAVGGKIRRNDPGGNIELRVYVNDDLKTSKIINGGATQEFCTELGALNHGDTIYVGVGPDREDYVDTYSLEFTIYPNP